MKFSRSLYLVVTDLTSTCMPTSLGNLLHSASYLIASQDSTERQEDVAAILRARLIKYYASCEVLPPCDVARLSLQDAQLRTACEAINVLESINIMITTDSSIELGTRDIGSMRTLLSISFKWGFDLLFDRLVASWPVTAVDTSKVENPLIIDLTDAPHNYDLLSSMVRRLMRMILPQGVEGTLSRTLIVDMIINRHFSQMIKSVLLVGWLPKSLSTVSATPLDETRPFTMKLFSMCVYTDSIIFLLLTCWN